MMEINFANVDRIFLRLTLVCKMLILTQKTSLETVFVEKKVRK